ncbi:TPA: hypothetical protein ACTXXA_002586 [Legionella anisa]
MRYIDEKRDMEFHLSGFDLSESMGWTREFFSIFSSGAPKSRRIGAVMLFKVIEYLAC